jgi:hypothetical protein
MSMNPAYKIRGEEFGMALLKVVHVAPDDSGWKVVQDGHIESVHRTQKAAIVAARVLATKKRAELVTHERDGRVRLKDSSPLIRREILESPGEPSVPRTKIAAAARFTFRDDVRFAPSKSIERKVRSMKRVKLRSSRKERIG